MRRIDIQDFMSVFDVPEEVSPHGTDARIPSRAECLSFCSEQGIHEHILEHSMQVADVALHVARLCKERFLPGLNLAMVEAAALLHDVAKDYAIQHGGNHSQLGAVWVQEWTGNILLSRAVLHHVYWPFALDLHRYPVSLIVLYSDKRVRHSEVVSLKDRFEDIVLRYAKTPSAFVYIQESLNQCLAVEGLLQRELKEDLHAHSFDCRRVV